MPSTQDPSRMLAHIEGLPRMVAEAWALPVEPPVPVMSPKSVVTDAVSSSRAALATLGSSIGNAGM